MVEIDIVPEALNPDVLYAQHPMPLIGAWFRARMNRTADKVRQEYRAEQCRNCGFVAFFKRGSPV